MKNKQPWKGDYFHLWYIFRGIKKWIFREKSIFGDDISRSADRMATKDMRELSKKKK